MSISPKRFTQGLVLIILCLTLGSIAGQYYKYFVNHGGRHLMMAQLFNLDLEGNLPTWYASSALLLCSLLLALIASGEKNAGARYRLHWTVLSIIFLGFSLDEAVSIHELSVGPLRTLLNAGGLLYWTWVVPGIAFVVIFVLAYLGFLEHLPPKTRRLFLTAGAIYVGGAIGVEMVGGYYFEAYGGENITYAMITTVEEFCEMLGIVIFIYALLSYLGSHLPDIHIRIGDGPPHHMRPVASSRQ